MAHPFLKSALKLDYRVAVIMGVLVAAAAYFGFFTVPASYITRAGCRDAGGTVAHSKCVLNKIELDIRS